MFSCPVVTVARAYLDAGAVHRNHDLMKARFFLGAGKVSQEILAMQLFAELGNVLFEALLGLEREFAAAVCFDATMFLLHLW